MKIKKKNFFQIYNKYTWILYARKLANWFYAVENIITCINMHSQPYNMKDFAWEWEIMIL